MSGWGAVSEPAAGCDLEVTYAGGVTRMKALEGSLAVKRREGDKYNQTQTETRGGAEAPRGFLLFERQLSGDMRGISSGGLFCCLLALGAPRCLKSLLHCAGVW